MSEDTLDDIEPVGEHDDYPDDVEAQNLPEGDEPEEHSDLHPDDDANEEDDE